MSIINQIVTNAIEAGSSDIHLEEEVEIAVRINSDIRISDQKLSSVHFDEILNELLSQEEKQDYLNKFDLDTSISIEGLARLRVNAYFSNNRRCLTLRILNDNVPNWKEIGLPQSFIDLSKFHKGLILCTGPTGSGKSTTLASFINYILNTQKRHIITIEDPVEYLFKNTKNSIIHQREVNRDTKNFSTALRAALREDPDVIYIGEMRDLETISLAMTAAETGHLVLGTLHTSSASKTVERIVDVFPGDQQEQARLQASTSIVGIMSQTLCKNNYGKRSLAYELMITNNAISNLIREKQINQIYSQIQTGLKDGMQTLDQCLNNLVKDNIISTEEALDKAFNKKSIINQ